MIWLQDLQTATSISWILSKEAAHHKQAKGLGLYLTKMQIEALGGSISVLSEKNKGTTFTVCFPKKTVH
jgi:sensor histidine kinase regulating citrate/malate metabolism